MKVVTLSLTEVERYARELFDKARIDGFEPDLLLAIQTGGAELGSIMKKHLKAESGYMACVARRQTTANKKKLLKKFLHYLPRPILDRLRIIEARKSFKRKSRSKIEDVVLPAGIEKYPRILVVDDAVDSGFTLKAVLEALKEAAPGSEVRSAAITITSENAAAETNYFIYHNEILVRFPWSMDAK